MFVVYFSSVLSPTSDSDGALLEESYALEAGGDLLVRTVTVTYRKDTIVSLKQVYDRLD